MDEFLAQQETVQQAKASCDKVQAKAKKEYKPAVAGILSKIEMYMKVGDLAIKSAPECVGLAWAGIRFCLHTFEDDFATFSLFSGAAADIIGILISCRVYGGMWGGSKGPKESQELHSTVAELIPGKYTDILDFSYQMKKQMNRNKAGRCLALFRACGLPLTPIVRFMRGAMQSASATFQSMIDNIKTSEKTMAGLATTAFEQMSTYYQEQGL